MRFLLLVLLVTSPAFAEDAKKPAVTRGDEPIAKTFSAEKSAEFLDGINLAWTVRAEMLCLPYQRLFHARQAAGSNRKISSAG